MRNRLLLALIALFGAAQFIRPARTAEPFDPSRDLIALTTPSAEVQQLLRTACTDCHSGQPRYPWYAAITPVNWWLQQHINEGREHFDASSWGSYPADDRAHVADEAIEMIKKEEMPLTEYTWTHGDARLSMAQREALTGYFGGLMGGTRTQDHD
ncbi:MAG TPA: heme-binding domain-containing protein [Flavobacteriales bacterium]|nr:heme-binding domain-containing protein [Flavobacteriales bacterium]HMR29155.1 heme-binding domain-containing protein [Flavobacteriales bacterium]